MAQDLSYEDPDRIFFSTIKTVNARLWFVNNEKLHERVLAYLARYQEMHGVVIYGFILMGNHYHLIAKFPRMNKGAFFRDFNSMIARLTGAYVETFTDGRLWARRVRSIPLGTDEDVKDKFMYASLNPVKAGLVRKLTEFSGYNSLRDALYDRRRKFKVVDWEDYNNRKRYNARLRVSECTTEHILRYSRLPGLENLSKSEYVQRMSAELESLRIAAIEERVSAGKGFATVETLRALRPGARPRTTKTSDRTSRRPLILTKCAETKRTFLEWYFAMRAAFKAASLIFRLGNLTTVFPRGTYRPPVCCLS